MKIFNKLRYYLSYRRERPLLPGLQRKNVFAMLIYSSMLRLHSRFFVGLQAKLEVLRLPAQTGRKLLGFLVICSFSGLAMAAPAKSLVLATEATYPPFESMNSQGQMVGFDIDILTAICTHMNRTCQFVNQPWDSLIPGLELGKFDVIFGSMAITPERQKRVDFTKPYYNNTASFVAAKASQLSLDPNILKDKTIGVQGSTTFDYYIQAVYGNILQTNRYASIQDALLDLQAGRIDAVFGDTPIILQWLNTGANIKAYTMVGQPISDTQFFGAGDGFAVKKGNTQLLQQLNRGIDAIKADGTYEKILQKYFGSSA